MRLAAQGYLLLVGTAIIAIAVILRLGAELPAQGAAVAPIHPASAPHAVLHATPPTPTGGAPADHGQTANEALPRLLLQLVVIIGVSYLIGSLFGRFGQPAVVGEMMAGILLGPSLFGWIAPNAFHAVFASGSLDPLRLRTCENPVDRRFFD